MASHKDADIVPDNMYAVVEPIGVQSMRLFRTKSRALVYLKQISTSYTSNERKPYMFTYVIDPEVPVIHLNSILEQE